MTTDSNIRLGLRKNFNIISSVSNLRAPGLFAKWTLLGTMMFLLGALTFGMLAYSVNTNDSFLRWDMETTRALQNQLDRIPSALVEYVIFGFYVGRELIVVLALTLGIYFWHKHFRRELMMVLWGPGLGGLLWYLLGTLFDRPRPPMQLDILLLNGPSFPSGHAMVAVLFYGLLAYLLAPKMPTRFWKWFVVLLLTLLTAWVGYSRILLGSHYLSDVIAGYAVGFAWAGLVYTLAERLVRKDQSATLPEQTKADNSVHGLQTPGIFAKRPIRGVILFLIGSLSFAALGVNLLREGPFLPVDQSIYETLIVKAKAGPAFVNELMIFGFFLGKQIILTIVSLLSLYFLYKRYWIELAMLLISSAGGSFIWNFFVTYFARLRPTDQTGLAVTSIPGFPSGHAMSLIICYGFLAYLLIPKMPSRVWKGVLVIATLVIILFGGFSRIFQGGHYLTDVLAGYALGMAWAALVYTLIETIFLRKKV